MKREGEREIRKRDRGERDKEGRDKEEREGERVMRERVYPTMGFFFTNFPLNKISHPLCLCFFPLDTA